MRPADTCAESREGDPGPAGQRNARTRAEESDLRAPPNARSRGAFCADQDGGSAAVVIN